MAKRMNIIPELEEILRLKEEGMPKGFRIALWIPSDRGK